MNLHTKRLTSARMSRSRVLKHFGGYVNIPRAVKKRIHSLFRTAGEPREAKCNGHPVLVFDQHDTAREYPMLVKLEDRYGLFAITRDYTIIPGRQLHCVGKTGKWCHAD